MKTVYVYNNTTRFYHQITYAEVKAALEADIVVQGLNGYSTGSPYVYQNLPAGIIEENPADDQAVSFSGGFIPILLNGFSKLALTAIEGDTDSPPLTQIILHSTEDIIKAELRSDPLGYGYANMTNEEKVAILNAFDRPFPTKTRFITARSFLAEMNPILGATIFAKLKAGGEMGNPVLQLAVDMLTTYSDGGGIDICHPNTIGSVLMLVPALLTEEEAAALINLSKTTRSRELIDKDITLEELVAILGN